MNDRVITATVLWARLGMIKLQLEENRLLAETFEMRKRLFKVFPGLE
jgi:hypothetical protein